MRILSLVLSLVLSATALADPLVMTVTDRDQDGAKYEKNLRKLTIERVYDADREARLVQFLKCQEVLEDRPWLQWRQAKRKDGDVVTYTVFLTVNPGFTTFRMTSDTDTQKTYVVEGLASIAGMQALSGDEFRLKSLGDPIIWERRMP